MNLGLIKDLRLVISILMVYFPTVAVSGFFAAWVAKKFGDDTAEQDGMLTLNPWEHTNIVGLITLVMAATGNFPFLFGFGQVVPLQEDRISPRYRKLKYFIALMARSIAGFLFLTLLTILASLTWKLIIAQGIDTSYPSFVKSLKLIFSMFVQLNVLSILMYAIFGLVRFIISVVFPDMSLNMLLLLLVEICLVILLWVIAAPYIYGLLGYAHGLFNYYLF